MITDNENTAKAMMKAFCKSKNGGKVAFSFAINVSKLHLEATISGHLLVQYDVSKTIVLTEE